MCPYCTGKLVPFMLQAAVLIPFGYTCNRCGLVFSKKPKKKVVDEIKNKIDNKS